MIVWLNGNDENAMKWIEWKLNEIKKCVWPYPT